MAGGSERHLRAKARLIFGSTVGKARRDWRVYIEAAGAWKHRELGARTGDGEAATGECECAQMVGTALTMIESPWVS